MTTLIPNQQQRLQLKQPLGELVAGTPEECIKRLIGIVREEKPPRLILVGDTVSKSAVQARLKPDVIILDNLEKRQATTPLHYTTKHVLGTRNVAGTIDSNAWKVVEEAIRLGDVLVNVEGEEDLLTLAAISSSPDHSIVVYGQPGEGIVIVRVSEKKKKEIGAMIAGMGRRN